MSACVCACGLARAVLLRACLAVAGLYAVPCDVSVMSCDVCVLIQTLKLGRDGIKTAAPVASSSSSSASSSSSSSHTPLTFGQLPFAVKHQHKCKCVIVNVNVNGNVNGNAVMA